MIILSNHSIIALRANVIESNWVKATLQTAIRIRLFFNSAIRRRLMPALVLFFGAIKPFSKQNNMPSLRGAIQSITFLKLFFWNFFRILIQISSPAAFRQVPSHRYVARAICTPFSNVFLLTVWDFLINPCFCALHDFVPCDAILAF